MKTLNYKIAREHLSENGRMKLQEAAAQILRMLEHDVCAFDYVLPDGWRCIVKVIDNTPFVADNPSYMELLYLDVQSNRGGGTYAEAKMNSMEQYTEFSSATQPIGVVRLMDLAVTDGEQCDTFQPVASVDALSDETWEWLRDKGIAPCYGGITIPYECLVSMPAGGGCNHGEIHYEMKKKTGIIRIAFSGASQEQDLFFALSVLRMMIEKADDIFSTAQAWFNLRGLEEIPAIKMWLQLLGIKEA